MKDYRGTPLKVGDEVAVYWSCNELKTGIVHVISGNHCKVKIYNGATLSKWKSGECMVKLCES